MLLYAVGYLLRLSANINSNRLQPVGEARGPPALDMDGWPCQRNRAAERTVEDTHSLDNPYRAP
jgi:hypothetical protein